MCTAVSLQNGGHYFGRNLDLEYGYREQITITPRNFPFRFRRAGEMAEHYAMIGMAYVAGGCPLYYEAVNEKGLAMAALNFPGNGVYSACRPDKQNLAPFELIPYVLGKCDSLAEAQSLLQGITVADLHFSQDLPNTPLHWMIADHTGSLVAEQMADGLHLYQNPVGVLTNNPSFDWHLTNLSNFMGISAAEPQNRFAPQLGLLPFSRGMGSLGLPGDHSSQSRFVRAAFVLHNLTARQEEEENVAGMFHILASVAMPKGCVKTPEGKEEYTRYSCCCSTAKGVYYYTTYQNPAITAVDMHNEDLDGRSLISYPMQTKPRILLQNQKGG